MPIQPSRYSHAAGARSGNSRAPRRPLACPVGALASLEVTGSLIVVQAVSAAATSALTVVYLGRLTVGRDREARAERDRDLVHEQLRRLVDVDVLNDELAHEKEFDIARAQVAPSVFASRWSLWI